MNILMQTAEKQERAKNILLDLYRGGFVETIYNTQNEKHQKEGWILKSGIWSPWYFNLRPVGACPKLVSDIAFVMNHMIRDEVPNLDQMLGIEMAGVPLVSAIATARGPGCQLISYSYTRALPGAIKPRKPEDAKRMLEEMDIEFGYGGKNLVEGRFQQGDVVCITDDMVTSFGSKLIAKLFLKYELKGRGIEGITADHVAVVLDREQGAEEEATRQGMHLYSLIRFKTDGLGWLKDIMAPQEHDLISRYQEDPEGVSQEKDKALEEAKKFREK